MGRAIPLVLAYLDMSCVCSAEAYLQRKVNLLKNIFLHSLVSWLVV